jgi:hypothetical protein
LNDPGNGTALHSLSTAESQLAADRGSALAHEEAADRALDTHLPPVDLPIVAGNSSS